jgi:SAM-dependent methyltransferase
VTSEPGPPLPAATAYRLWAATYDEETPVTALDELAVLRLTPSPLPGRLLDAACGTARRLVLPIENGVRAPVGIDLVFEMLHAGRRHPDRPRTTAVGDAAVLPVSDGSFDVAWCRLAAGHLPALAPFYREMARVLRPGGAAIVTDFHPAAARAGLARAFRDGAGTGRRVEHFLHEPADHERAARAAGLFPSARLDLPIDGEVRPFFEEAGALDRFERLQGLPVLLAFRFLLPAPGEGA